MNRFGLIIPLVLIVLLGALAAPVGGGPPGTGLSFPVSRPWLPGAGGLGAGGAVVHGQVTGYPGATVICSAAGSTSTTAVGNDSWYECTGLPAATGNGEIWVQTHFPSALVMGRVALAWGDPRPADFDFLRSGPVDCRVTRGGPMPSPTAIRINLSGSDGASPTRSWDSSAVVSGPDPLTVHVLGMQGSRDSVAVYWWDNEGVKAQIDTTIVPSPSPTPTLGPFDEADAYRTKITSPRWASGAPGTRVTLRLLGYPNG
jgi:hypothetical protein